jgi:predicted transcriptional regulator
MSIAELQREINIKRSTLIYYINSLMSEGWITKDRVEKKETGRPTYLILNKEKYLSENKLLQEEIIKYQNEVINNILTRRILKEIKSNKDKPEEIVKLLSSMPQDSFSLSIPYTLNLLIEQGYILLDYKIKLTSKGIEFLKNKAVYSVDSNQKPLNTANHE